MSKRGVKLYILDIQDSADKIVMDIKREKNEK